MAERKLTVEPGEQIEAEDGDGVDHRQRELKDEKILHHERQSERDSEQRQASDRGADDVGESTSGRAEFGTARASLPNCCDIATRPDDDGAAEQPARLLSEHRDDDARARWSI